MIFMDQVKIGKFIAKLRKEKNMTQQQLADKIGVSFKTISKWETGRGMPELSLLKPLSEQLEVSINELLSGERVQAEQYLGKLEENMLNTIEYNEQQKEERNKKIGSILLIVGIVIIVTAIGMFPSESSWSSIYSVVGTIVALVGCSKFTKQLSYTKRCLVHFGFFALVTVFLFTLDFANVVRNEQPPRFSFKTVSGDNRIDYYTPFYNVYRINKNTKNEYYIIDVKKEYQEDTVPVSPFNRTRSGIDNIIKYQSKYMGNNSNIGNLLSNLPLAEYGYVFEMDSTNLALSVNYHTTSWYIEEDLYRQKSLIYNSVALIENLNSITYNFTGNSYTITRKIIEEKLDSYFEVVKDGKIQKDKFNRLIEAKMNDNEWVEAVEKNLFESSKNDILF